MFKHLHGHGEDIALRADSLNHTETPPRTWRRQLPGQQALAVARNTSTDVEKTEVLCLGIQVNQKHLHGRGEDVWMTSTSLTCRETPPRTWRRLCAVQAAEVDQGNTSTDVEKTARFGIKLL